MGKINKLFLSAVSVMVVVCYLISTAAASDLENQSATGSGPNGTLTGQQLANSSVEEECRLQYTQLPESFTRLTAYHLILGRQNGASEKSIDVGHSRILNRIEFNDSQSMLKLKKSDLNPQWPIIFFTNGFNNDGVLDGTWMEDVAKVYLARFISADTNGKNRPGVNVIFLNWHLEGLLATSSLSVIPVYYKTMANYGIIVSRFEHAFGQIFDHVDKLRAELGVSSIESDREYYGKFKFFGHSLGAHILANALNRVHKSSHNPNRFGQIYGLDPAVPCFFNDQQGLTATRAMGLAREVMILHSNAGILGAFSNRGQIEIVLNGGTFQPNCTWLDLRCHHVRSTDILRYTDDSCKMVAYKCNKHEQFKLGACETCDSPSELSDSKNSTANCLLVNLEEQNEDSEEINDILMSSGEQQVRQLADNDGDIYNFERANSIRLKLAKEMDYLRNARPEYHFVNTNPKFKETPTKSHCLQHYQLRLLTLSDQSNSSKCPLKLLYGDKINIQLFQETMDRACKGESPNRQAADQSSEFKLTTIIANQLHTGLATFEGPPRLFAGGIIENIDLKSWLECSRVKQEEYRANERSTSMEFVLDIAFMSHTKKSIRHAFSSVLCAELPNEDDHQKPNHLVLNLCHQSDLMNVSHKINHLLKKVKFHNQFEPWHVVLLNSLFSLFSGWEPL